MSTTFPQFRAEPTGQRSPKTGQPTYRLLERMIYDDPELGEIAVPMGFITDYLSLGAWYARLYARLFGGAGRASAIVHDYAYQVMVPSKQCTRTQADGLFDRALRREGVWAWLREALVAGVRANTEKRSEK